MASLASFTSHMITINNDKRLKNYETQSANLPNLEKWDATNTIENSNYFYWKEYALTNNYTTSQYINEIENSKFGFLKGKLGCNLSHQFLLEYLSKQTEPWHLVCEDDLIINSSTKSESITFLNELISNIPKQSHFVQLCIYPQFKNKQESAKTISAFEANNAVFKIQDKIQQFGTCAYLISHQACKYMACRKPWVQNIDFLYNSLDNDFKSVAVVNPYFQCAGSTDKFDNNQNNNQFGSLIWNNE